MTEPAANPQRRTRQRAAVDEILSHLEEFRTAQQIHDVLRRQGDSVGLRLPTAAAPTVTTTTSSAGAVDGPWRCRGRRSSAGPAR
jgi:hypothetical protein